MKPLDCVGTTTGVGKHDFREHVDIVRLTDILPDIGKPRTLEDALRQITKLEIAVMHLKNRLHHLETRGQTE